MTYGQIEHAVVAQYYGFLVRLLLCISRKRTCFISETFQVFNVLLITTITGSIFSTLHDIFEKPEKLLELLGQTVPTVSNFFVNYIILQALLGPGMEILQIVPLIVRSLKLMLLTSTPRQIKEQSSPPEFQSGVALAKHSFIATVSLFNDRDGRSVRADLYID